MVKHICDICRTNTATNNYRIKQLKQTVEIDDHGVFPKSVWVDIDICTACLIDIVQAKRRIKI